MIGCKYRCKPIGRIPVVDAAERGELLALLPAGFVLGNIAEVVGTVRREEPLVLFTREADPGTKRVFEMPRWAFSAWFEEVV